MTVPQALFLVALSLVILAILVFVGVISAAARRTDGGSYFTRDLARRLAVAVSARSELNRWAFYAHRVSGAAIYAFLCLHILDVSLYSFSPGLYNNVHVLYGTTAMRVFECGLLVAILFHTLNGLRLLAIDVADIGRIIATRALIGVTALTIGAGIAGSVFILAPELI